MAELAEACTRDIIWLEELRFKSACRYWCLASVVIDITRRYSPRTLKPMPKKPSTLRVVISSSKRNFFYIVSSFSNEGGCACSQLSKNCSIWLSSSKHQPLRAFVRNSNTCWSERERKGMYREYSKAIKKYWLSFLGLAHISQHFKWITIEHKIFKTEARFWWWNAPPISDTKWQILATNHRK